MQEEYFVEVSLLEHFESHPEIPIVSPVLHWPFHCFDLVAHSNPHLVIRVLVAPRLLLRHQHLQ